MKAVEFKKWAKENYQQVTSVANGVFGNASEAQAALIHLGQDMTIGNEEPTLYGTTFTSERQQKYERLFAEIKAMIYGETMDNAQKEKEKPVASATAEVVIGCQRREVTATYWEGHGKHKIYFNNLPYARKGERVSLDLDTNKAYGKSVETALASFEDFINAWKAYLSQD